jgi:hypothetical protein
LVYKKCLLRNDACCRWFSVRQHKRCLARQYNCRWMACELLLLLSAAMVASLVASYLVLHERLQSPRSAFLCVVRLELSSASESNRKCIVWCKNRRDGYCNNIDMPKQSELCRKLLQLTAYLSTSY